MHLFLLFSELKHLTFIRLSFFGKMICGDFLECLDLSECERFLVSVNFKIVMLKG